VQFRFLRVEAVMSRRHGIDPAEAVQEGSGQIPDGSGKG